MAEVSQEQCKDMDLGYDLCTLLCWGMSELLIPKNVQSITDPKKNLKIKIMNQ